VTEEQDAYWDGFLVGAIPPGILDEYPGYESPDRFRITGTSNPWSLDWSVRVEIDVETTEDKAYWMGLTAGVSVATGLVSGALYIASGGVSGSFAGWLAVIGGEALVAFAPAVPAVVALYALDQLVEATTTPGATVESKDVGGSHTYKVVPKIGFF
jgi:hypothetical protein